MKRLPIWAACMGLMLTLGMEAPKATAADVSISIGIGDRYRGPRIHFVRRPHVVIVPGTRVYYISNYDYDMYRYGRFWYFYSDGGWYRARHYEGPFVFIGFESVPRSIRVIPTSYRRHWREYRGHAYGTYRDGRWYRDNRRSEVDNRWDNNRRDRRDRDNDRNRRDDNRDRRSYDNRDRRN